MSITVNSFTFDRLQAQPFVYSSENVSQGRVARSWAITGLVTPSEWLSLLSEFDTWRASRIDEEDSAVSGVIGTTVSFSGTGPGSQSWTNVSCWFTEAPQADDVGAYLRVSFTLIDATEQLAIILKSADNGAVSDLPDFGTITLGTTTLTLLKPPDVFANGPSVEQAATGSHYITGALSATEVKDIQGETDFTGWENIRAWYVEQIAAVPLAGSYFPISTPTATAENRIVDGIKQTVYIVSILLVKIK